ncbi:RDD family protein [Chloroflexota bacterium]
MTEEGASQKHRYVWDPEKLLWVESADGPTVKEEVIERSIEKVSDVTADDEYYESIPAEISPEYTEALEYRGAWIRLMAMAIDILLLGFVGVIINTILDALDISLGTWIFSVVGIFYFIGFWAWRGQSLGKMAIGAKIVKLDGSPIGIGRAVLRYLGYFIYIQVITYSANYVSLYLAVAVFIVIFLVLILNKNKRGLHDMLAGTAVINSRPSPLEEYEEEDYYDAEEESGTLKAS